METSPALIKGEDIQEILNAEIPGLKTEQHNEGNLFKIIDGFAGYTIGLMKKGNLYALKNCFNTAERLLIDGSSEVKLAIENIFVYSVTVFFDMGNAVSRQVKELLPPHLMDEYHKQVSNICP
jgi:hypothetical protein